MQRFIYFNSSQGVVHIRKRQYRLSSLFLAALFVLTFIIPIALRASAVSDTTPMQLIDLQISQSTADVSSGPAVIDLSGEVFEDLSGFNTIEYFYLSPSGNQIIEGDANSDPQFINESFLIPQYAEPGLWRPTFTLVDNATNSVTLGPDDLAGLGFNVDITVTSSPTDVMAPSITNLTLSNSTVDTATGDTTLSATITATDNLTGVNIAKSQIFITSPSGNQTTSSLLANAGSNQYTAQIPFRQYAEVGVWTIEVTLVDGVSNTLLYDSSDLALLSLPNTVTVTGNGDTTPVSIDNLVLAAANPPLTGTSIGSAEITIYAAFSDNLSGFSFADLTYRSQTTSQSTQTSVFFDGINYQYTVKLPQYAATGVWLPELVVSDHAGNVQSYQYADLVNLGYNLQIELIESESATVVAGGTVSTDTEGDGSTPSDPFEATVSSPNPGSVSITQTALTNPVSANNYLVFNQQFDIVAPNASFDDPLILVFTIDSSNVQGQTAENIAVFRDGDLLEDCEDPLIADPDPCVGSRVTLGDGDVQITVRTSEASIWVLGYPQQAPYSFDSFEKPIKNSPVINDVNAGRTIPIKFDIGGDFGLNILGPDIATSQRVDCTTFNAIGDETPVNVTNNGGLSIDDSVYRFNWKTTKQWQNTCRQLILSFDTGEVVVAYFSFD